MICENARLKRLLQDVLSSFGTSLAVYWLRFCAANAGGEVLISGWGPEIHMLCVLMLAAQPHPALCEPMTAAYRAPLSMGFLRQEYWSGWPSPSPGDLPNPGIEPWSPILQADSLPSEPPGNWAVQPKRLKINKGTHFWCTQQHEWISKAGAEGKNSNAKEYKQ